MKRFKSIISKSKAKFERTPDNDENGEFDFPVGDSPEANAARGVKLFCEAGSEGSETAQGDEVVHLPTIVEATESSPSAATTAAQRIRKYISQTNSSRPHVQYKAIMLMRILTDNPGPTFTRNIDAKFVSTVRDVLRTSRDPSVQQIVRETLSAMYREKAYDENLTLLFNMFQKEGGVGPRVQTAIHQTGTPSSSQRYLAAAHNGERVPSRTRGGHNRLPQPGELAGRIEEARTTAKLLQQMVQSTPAAELKGNEMVGEFAERCQTAQRSVQGYIHADDPGPDDETMVTLINTSELLSGALSTHARALLQARRAAGSSPSVPQVGSATPTPPLPPRADGHTANALGIGSGAAAGAAVPAASWGVNTGLEDDDDDDPRAYSSYSPPPLLTNNNKVPSVPAAVTSHSYSPPPLGPTQVPAHSPPAGTSATVSGPLDPFSDAHASDLPLRSHPVSALRPQTPEAAARPNLPAVGSSYVRRQDDATATGTMHGVLDSSPVSPDRYGFDSPISHRAPTSGLANPVFAGEAVSPDAATRFRES